MGALIQEIDAKLVAEQPDWLTDLWDIEANWVEPLNRRRGGWSGAKLVYVNGQSWFVKQHENHLRRDWRHPLIGRPTLDREAEALRALNAAHVKVPELIHYVRRRVAGKWRAVLVLPELVGYRSLWDLTVSWKKDGWPETSVRRLIASAIGQAIGELHRAGWRHGHFHPKHVLIRFRGNSPCVYLVDLEKARPIRQATRDAISDLGSFYRRSRHASPFDQVAFMKGYFQNTHLGPSERRIMRQVAQSS